MSRWAFLLCVLAFDSSALAQDIDDDPIGLDPGDEQMRTMTLPSPGELVEPPPIPPREGAILTAISGVEERSHEIAIELRDGLAIVSETIALVSTASEPAEARYRLAVPEGAALVALEVCNDRGCRRGLPAIEAGALTSYDDAARARGGASGLPIGHAVLARDARGPAIVIRAAPVIEGGEALRVQVRWALRTPVRGGQMRWVLPARGFDGRAAESTITLEAIDLVGAAIDGVPAEQPMQRPPGAAVEITASSPLTAETRASLELFPCGAGRCARARVTTAPPRIPPVEIVIAIDASPSTAVSARGRIAPAIRMLLATLPAESQVRVVTFASRAEELGSGWRAPESIDGDALGIAVESRLGSATRFEAVWGLCRSWLHRGARIVIVGDGGLTLSDAARAALAEAAASEVLVGSINVADRSSTDGLRVTLEQAGGIATDVGQEAEEVAAGRSPEPFVASVTALLAPVAARDIHVTLGGQRVRLGPLRAGEELVWEAALGSRGVQLAVDRARVRGRPADSSIAPSLSALADRGLTPLAALAVVDVHRRGGLCSPRGPFETESAVVPETSRLALAHPRRCEPFPDLSLGRPTNDRSELPDRALLANLRRQVMPVARLCFRDDRGGRAGYQERAELVLELADREISSTRVEGTVSAELEECLLAAIDRLEVPPFEGTILARWPLYTAAALPPPVLELPPEIADEVDRVAADEPSPPQSTRSEPFTTP